MRKVVLAASVVGCLVLGTLAVAVFNPLGPAGAQNDPGSTVPAPPATEAPKADPGREQAKPDHKGKGPGKAQGVLEELVADGTITQAQADKIRERLKARMGEGNGPGGRHGNGKGKHGGAMGNMHETMALVAGILGIDVKTLREEHHAGKSLADIARAHNVDPQRVIDALVAEANKKIDAAVASGRLTPEKAAEMKTSVVERVTKRVNDADEQGDKGPRHGPKGPEKPGDDDTDDGPDDDADEAPPAPAPAPTTTAPPEATPGTAGN